MGWDRAAGHQSTNPAAARSRRLPANAPRLESGGDRTAESRRARVAIDRVAVVLFFPVETRADARHFFGASRVNRLAGLLLGVDAEAAEEIGHAFDDATGPVEPREQVPIQGELETRVDAAGLVPGALPPEHGFLRDVIDPLQRGCVVPRHHPAADVAVFGVDDDAVTVDHVHRGVRRKIFGDVAQCARGDQVVGVEPRHDVIRAEARFEV